MYGLTSRGQRYYSRGGYENKGATSCDRNSVRQDQVLNEVITAIEGQYLNTKVIQRSRESLCRQIKSSVGKQDVGKLRKELTTLEKKSQTAKRNLALVDPEHIPDVQATFQELKAKQQ